MIETCVETYSVVTICGLITSLNKPSFQHEADRKMFHKMSMDLRFTYLNDIRPHQNTLQF